MCGRRELLTAEYVHVVPECVMLGGWHLWRLIRAFLDLMISVHPGAFHLWGMDLKHFATFHIFMDQFIVCYIKTYSLQEGLPNHI